MTADRRVLRFVKMHGAGNDYVYLDGLAQTLPADLPALARRLAHRNTGVGGDGIIALLPSDDADVRMAMFNLDGSEGQMCGNGVRCVAKLASDNGHVAAGSTRVRVETAGGVVRDIELIRDGDEVVAASVDMGEPRVGREAVGLTQGSFARSPYFRRVDGEHLYALNLARGEGPIEFVPVSTGNPHAVVFVHDVAAVDLPRLGPALATHPAFADGVNAHFAQVLSETRLRVRHWERGSGPTLACGTGACACCVAGVLTARTARRVVVEVPGGELQIEWDEPTNRLRMTGPAVEVFRGELRL